MGVIGDRDYDFLDFAYSNLGKSGQGSLLFRFGHFQHNWWLLISEMGKNRCIYKQAFLQILFGYSEHGMRACKARNWLAKISRSEVDVKQITGELSALKVRLCLKSLFCFVTSMFCVQKLLVYHVCYCKQIVWKYQNELKFQGIKLQYFYFKSGRFHKKIKIYF